MDTSEVERELEELETRLERLRALYEQHFMGLEKLEPLIPRKDVDRRIWVLRREQIRNTGLRFKFQMLIQRYNTFQQYWGRILREIENGTYRRDVMRAAKRFGAQEALTILGKRRAKKYADLAAVQEAKRGPLPKEAAVEELPDEYLEEEPPENERIEDEYLGDDDLEEDASAADDDAADEAPTPAPAPRPALNIPPPRPTDPDAAKRRVAELAAQGRASRPEAPTTSSPAGPLELDLDFDSPRPAPKPAHSPRRASTAKMNAVKPASPGAPVKPPGAASGGRKSSARNMRVRAFIAVQPPRASAASTPPASTPAPAVRPSPAEPPAAAPAARPQDSPPPAASKPAEPSPSVDPPARPQERARPTAPARAAAVDRGLEEPRLRQIYAKYIETRRSVNEPTAGITFEKLAESLRVQAAKLREAHPVRSVDYDVVVKNGKTLIKPILK